MHLDAAIAPWKKIFCKDFFRTLIYSPELASHVIDSLFSLHLKHYSSMTLVCGWVLLRIKSAKCFYLNFIFLWMFSTVPTEPGAFLSQAIYACMYWILICSSLKVGVEVEYAGCISTFISKSKVSYKYYGFGQLIFLGLYFYKTYIPGMNQLKAPKVKNSHLKYDNSIEQQKISS